MGDESRGVVSDTSAPSDRFGPLFWASLAIGWAGIGFGAWSAWSHMGPSARASFALFVVGAALVHDVVVAPLAIVVGTVVARRTPRLARAAIGGALVVSGMITLAMWPVIRRYGEIADNPSFLPNPAGVALLFIVAGVWAVAGARILRARRH